MGIIYDAVFGRTNPKAHAKILVQCKKCKKPDYIFAEITAQLEVVDPDLSKMACRHCRQIGKLKRILDEK